MIRKITLTIVLSAVACTTAFAQNPPFANGTFCTQGKGYYSNNLQAAKDLQSVYNRFPPPAPQEFTPRVAGVVPAAQGNSYQWNPTGTLVDIGKGVSIDSAFVALREALGASGQPGAFSMNATNPTDMGTAGTLATQRVALGLNADFSLANAAVLPVGFNVLNLTNTGNLTLDGQLLTTTQANALNGRSVPEVSAAADSALGTAQLPFGLSSFVQLTDLLDLLNQSFAGCQPSAFAQSFVYQPYITSPSGAFSGRRPIGNAGFALRPSGGTFQGEIVSVGRGCNVDGTYPANPNGKIALIERGLCGFVEKVTKAKAAGATAAIIYNSSGPVLTRGEGVFEMGGGSQPIWLHIPDAATDIPAVFVQRSTGLALIGGTAPVSVFVKE